MSSIRRCVCDPGACSPGSVRLHSPSRCSPRRRPPLRRRRAPRRRRPSRLPDPRGHDRRRVTVIKGTTVEQFDVEVLGVLPDYIFLGVDIIVMRMTGPAGLVETTGGAVAGMSGSPVYLNGKLAGALAWAVAEDRRIFGVTAAEDMVGIFGFEDAAGGRGRERGPLARRPVTEGDPGRARLRLDAHRFRGARVATGAARRLGAGRDPARGHRAGLRGPRHAGFGVPLGSVRAPSAVTIDPSPSRPERVWASPCPTATSPTTGSAPRPPSAATWRSGSATRCSTTRPARSRSG